MEARAYATDPHLSRDVGTPRMWHYIERHLPILKLARRVPQVAARTLLLFKIVERHVAQ